MDESEARLERHRGRRLPQPKGMPVLELAGQGDLLKVAVEAELQQGAEREEFVIETVSTNIHGECISFGSMADEPQFAAERPLAFA